MHGKVLVIVPDPVLVLPDLGPNFHKQYPEPQCVFFIDICSNSLCSKWALFFLSGKLKLCKTYFSSVSVQCI